MTTVRHPHRRKQQAEEEKRPSDGVSQHSTRGPLGLLQQPKALVSASREDWAWRV